MELFMSLAGCNVIFNSTNRLAERLFGEDRKEPQSATNKLVNFITFASDSLISKADASSD